MEYVSSLATFTILAAALGVLCLSLPLLLIAGPGLSVGMPLLVFLLASGAANSLPLWIEFFPELDKFGLAIVLPCYMLLPVSLWFYVRAITSSSPWRFHVKHAWHGLPVVAALVVSVCLFALPDEDLHRIFDENDTALSWWPQTVIICAFALMVMWVVISSSYVIAITMHLTRFRRRLKHLFSNNDQRELYWLSAVVYVLAAVWALSLLYSVPLLTNQPLLLPIEVIALAHLGLLWTLSLFGIKQKPAFEGHYLEPDESDVNGFGGNDSEYSECNDSANPNSNAEYPENKSAASSEDHALVETEAKEKYQKSGLKNEELERIAGKIEAAMTHQQLYLNASLSLQLLAKEIHVSSNYLSQTLNVMLNKSFFDYINSWRIRHAIPEVLEAQKSILNIAMDAGFNARSSFYKAFKNETGCSPTEYRKQNTV